MLLGLNLIKRITGYLFFSFLWGFMFIALFNYIMRYGYMYSYFYDSLFSSLFMLLIFASTMEILRIITFNKYKKVKIEIEKESIVTFDKPATLEVDFKSFEGWIFLTKENIIFKSLKKKKPQSLSIPLISIQNIAKFKLAAIIINSYNGNYKFILSQRDCFFDLLNSKN